MTKTIKKEITKLNDDFRQTFVGGKVVYTPGVQGISLDKLDTVINHVQAYTDFSKDNDPFDEHDFGSFVLDDINYFWKIDYYAPDLEFASEDPSNPKITTRVLTIMTAEEY